MLGMVGKYSAKRKQDLDGIATLTNDALALENIRKGKNNKGK